jgi:hypothetical protein
LRCLVCGKPLDQKERPRLVHAVCRSEPLKPD